jgi:hypothetical protein
VSWTFGRTEEERCQRAAITLLLNRVVLVLLDDARHAGGFGDDEAALESRAVALTKGFLDPASLPGDISVRLKLLKGDRIEFRVGEHEGMHATAEVRGDGYVLSGSTGQSGRAVVTKPEDMEPWEREEQRRRKLAHEAAKGKPKFHGREYLRTVAAPSQPGAALRILAAALYDDGLIVEFTYDTEVPSREDLERMPETPRPPMRIEDDLGTDYYEGERAGYGGSPASQAHFSFAPAVPAGARALRITTDSGTVELDLQL